MFEMFKPFNTQMERFHLINNLLQGNIAKDLRISRPAEVCSNEYELVSIYMFSRKLVFCDASGFALVTITIATT